MGIWATQHEYAVPEYLILLIKGKSMRCNNNFLECYPNHLEKSEKRSKTEFLDILAEECQWR